MAFIILVVEPLSVVIESANALRITFQRGCSALEVGLDVDGASDLPRFWASGLFELSIVAI